MKHKDAEHGRGSRGKVLAATALAAALVVPAWGCGEELGECEIVCTFLSDGSTS